MLDYFATQNLDVHDLDEALERLALRDERQARIVSLRYILRLTNREIAEHLGVSVSTVEAELRLARAWLRRELGAGPADEDRVP